MAKYVNVKFEDEDQYDRVERLKDERGLTWRGMLVHAADDLEQRG